MTFIYNCEYLENMVIKIYRLILQYSLSILKYEQLLIIFILCSALSIKIRVINKHFYY